VTVIQLLDTDRECVNAMTTQRFWFKHSRYEKAKLKNPKIKTTADDILDQVTENCDAIMLTDKEITPIVDFLQLGFGMIKYNRDLLLYPVQVGSILVNLLYICGACYHPCF